MTACNTAGAVSLADGIASTRRSWNSARNHQRRSNLKHRASMQAVRCQQIITVHPEAARNRTGAISRLDLIAAALRNAASAAPLCRHLQLLTDTDDRLAVKAVNRNQRTAVYPKRGRNPAGRVPCTHGIFDRPTLTSLERHHPKPCHLIAPAVLPSWQTQLVPIWDEAPAVPDKTRERRVQYL